jgi:lysophospholipase L1-like esterase
MDSDSRTSVRNPFRNSHQSDNIFAHGLRMIYSTRSNRSPSPIAALATLVLVCHMTTVCQMTTAQQSPADQPVSRTDANSLVAHSQLLAKAKQPGIDVYFEGDSITRRWGALDYPDLLANWKNNFFGWNAADFGWGADRTQNILWRLENGELDGVNPKVVVLLAGTNNVGDLSTTGGGDAKADTKVDDITRGIQAILHAIQKRAPAATIIVMGIFPRNDNMAFIPVINRINHNLSEFADGKKIRYLNINDKLADGNGRLVDGMMNAKDKLHPTVKAYQIWADALKPILTELLGPPAAVDHAPPPTGDPAAGR